MTENLETATFGGGCFWCTEAIFKRLKGVISVKSGYSGGKAENPNYATVSMGNSGHAEAVQITFDPKIITYERLLDVFWATHNPTTMNRQGNDTGTQYRSVIFYHTDNQKEQALTSKKRLEIDKVYNDPIITQIAPFSTFYPAEDYHQNYYDNNKSYPYCSVIISPKIDKLLKEFGKDVKEEYL